MSKKITGLRFQENRKPAGKTIPVGKKQPLTITRLSHDGRGIALLDNKTWFVSGALPEEKVIARVLSSQGKSVNARCEQVITASAVRQQPPCSYAGACGGCDLQHISYQDQIALKQQNVKDQFHRLANINFDNWSPPLLSKPFEYRRRTRIAVRYNEQTDQLDIGFRAAFSQQIINVTNCLVLEDTIASLLKQIPACLQQLSAKKHIGHIELFNGSTPAMLIRHTAPLPETDISLLSNFCTTHHCQLWLQGKDQPSPYLADKPLHYNVSTSQLQLTLNYQMGDFVQVNTQINQAMVLQALDWLKVQPDETVLDLFSGLGNFTLPLATQAKEVVAIEAVKDMVELAQQNAKYNHLTNINCYSADLNQPLSGEHWSKQAFTAILLDPPREGAADIITQMKKLDTKRILYVSCNPATLARDAKLLLEQGYRITKAGIMDMFPQTAHIEVMVLFER